MYIVFLIIWITDFLGFYFYYKTTFKGKLLNCFFLYQTLLKIVKYDKSTYWSEVKMWFYQWNFILERMLKKNFFFLHFNFFFCRNYTSRPRMSGTSGGYELVQILYNSWKSFGIDEVKVAPYDVLMSYPNRTNPNRVRSCIIFYMTPPP